MKLADSGRRFAHECPARLKGPSEPDCARNTLTAIDSTYAGHNLNVTHHNAL
jgi:hypothetical protein